jgi:hypothetical protein
MGPPFSKPVPTSGTGFRNPVPKSCFGSSFPGNKKFGGIKARTVETSTGLFVVPARHDLEAGFQQMTFENSSRPD